MSHDFEGEGCDVNDSSPLPVPHTNDRPSTSAIPVAGFVNSPRIPHSQLLLSLQVMEHRQLTQGAPEYSREEEPVSPPTPSIETPSLPSEITTKEAVWVNGGQAQTTHGRFGLLGGPVDMAKLTQDFYLWQAAAESVTPLHAAQGLSEDFYDASFSGSGMKSTYDSQGMDPMYDSADNSSFGDFLPGSTFNLELQPSFQQPRFPTGLRLQDTVNLVSDTNGITPMQHMAPLFDEWSLPALNSLDIDALNSRIRDDVAASIAGSYYVIPRVHGTSADVPTATATARPSAEVVEITTDPPESDDEMNSPHAVPSPSAVPLNINSVAPSQAVVASGSNSPATAVRPEPGIVLLNFTTAKSKHKRQRKKAKLTTGLNETGPGTSSSASPKRFKASQQARDGSNLGSSPGMECGIRWTEPTMHSQDPSSTASHSIPEANVNGIASSAVQFEFVMEGFSGEGGLGTNISNAHAHRQFNSPDKSSTEVDAAEALLSMIPSADKRTGEAQVPTGEVADG